MYARACDYEKCGKKFETKLYNKIYCSKKCASRAKKLKDKMREGNVQYSLFEDKKEKYIDNSYDSDCMFRKITQLFGLPSSEHSQYHPLG